MKRLQDDREARAYVQARSAVDPGWWTHNFGFTFDPREEESLQPFRLWNRQFDFFDWVYDLETANKKDQVVVEKSRDAGASWCAVSYLVNRWLYRPGFVGGLGSRKLNLVDLKGHPGSLFEKARIILRHLPLWMLPDGFEWSEHDNHCRLINPKTMASLIGEGGDEIGRGDRATIYVVDEAAFLRRASLVDASISQTARIVIWLSTPHGRGNVYAQKRFNTAIKVFVFDWKDDPRKSHWELRKADDPTEIVDQGPGGSKPPEVLPDGTVLVFPWYENECILQDEVTVAQEIDRNYDQSLEGITIPLKWVQAAVELDLPAKGRNASALDIAGGGRAFNAYGHRIGPFVTRVERWRGKEHEPTENLMTAVDHTTADGADRFIYDSVAVGSFAAGTMKRIKARIPFKWFGINTGVAPSKMLWPDGDTSEEKFANLKAELWWLLRDRFRKTFEFVMKGTYYPPDELISIPNDEALIDQLSNVRYFERNDGKIIIETKDQLTKRDVPSPDLADMTVLLFAPVKDTRGAKATGKPKETEVKRTANRLGQNRNLPPLDQPGAIRRLR